MGVTNSNPLPLCSVHRSNGWETVGFLYFENERVVVLLNDIVHKTDLGSIKNFRCKHVEPEATIVIIPRDQVKAVEIL